MKPSGTICASSIHYLLHNLVIAFKKRCREKIGEDGIDGEDGIGISTRSRVSSQRVANQ